MNYSLLFPLNLGLIFSWKDNIISERVEHVIAIKTKWLQNWVLRKETEMKKDTINPTTKKFQGNIFLVEKYYLKWLWRFKSPSQRVDGSLAQQASKAFIGRFYLHNERAPVSTTLAILHPMNVKITHYNTPGWINAPKSTSYTTLESFMN